MQVYTYTFFFCSVLLCESSFCFRFLGTLLTSVISFVLIHLLYKITYYSDSGKWRKFIDWCFGSKVTICTHENRNLIFWSRNSTENRDFSSIKILKKSNEKKNSSNFIQTKSSFYLLCHLYVYMQLLISDAVYAISATLYRLHIGVVNGEIISQQTHKIMAKTQM